MHRSGRSCPNLLAAEYLYQLFRILLHDRFVCSVPFHLFIYWTIYLSEYQLIDIHFILCVVIQYCFLFFLKWSGFVHWVPFQVDSCAISLLWVFSFPFFSFLPVFLFFFLSYFLILQDAPDLYFPFPALELTTSPRSSGSFC